MAAVSPPHYRHYRILFLCRAYDKSDARIFSFRSDFFIPCDRADRDIVLFECKAAVPLVALLDRIFEFDPQLPAGNVVFTFVSDRDPVQRVVALALFPAAVLFYRYRTVFFEALTDFALEDVPDAAPLELLPFDVPPVPPESFPFICLTT